MAAISAKDIQALRQSTGVGMLDAKKALEQNDGTRDEAIKWLRKEGLMSAAKREDREASEGAVAIVRQDNVGAMVELRCETDFVAKSPDFVTLVDELAALVASKGESAVEEMAGEVDRLKTTLKENISVGRIFRLEAGDGEVIDTYLHVQAGRGKVGVMIVLHGGTPELAHDVAVHAAFTKPLYISRDDVPAAEVEAERATVEEISRKEGKPEAALAKVVEGRMNGWFKDRCLLEQAYVKDEKTTVAKLLGSATVEKLALVVIGS